MSDIVKKQIRALHEKKQEILNLPPEEALEAILSARHPSAIVHACTEQDFHLLIHDIGVDDSRPLLALATDRQVEYIVDTEIWNRDRINYPAATRWLDTLFRTDPDRTTRWLMTDKLEFLETFLFKNIQVIIREHDQESSSLPESYFTHDDTLYINIPDYPHPEGPEAADENLRKQLLQDLINRMAATDYPLYRNIIFETMAVIPAEATEEEYRLRNVRMAEKGFLPYEEAVGIYQPITAKHLFSQSPKVVFHPNGPGHLPVPVLSAAFMDKGGLFSRTMKTIDNPELAAQLQTEFATLCNQVIVADKKIIREKRQLEAKVKKACGYISLGLEHLTTDGNKVDLSRASALVSTYRLAEIFRVGYGLCLKLKWQTQKWQRNSWVNRSKLSLNFWGEAWLGVLGGLLLDHPRFYDNYTSGVLYRDFESLADIEQTQSLLEAVTAFDDLLSKMDIVLEPLDSYGYVGHYNLVLTLWARQILDVAGKIRPLSIEDIRKFFIYLWGAHEKPYIVSDENKEHFLRWVSGEAGLPEHDISRTLGQTFETLFKNLAEEFSNVSPRDLELKYVQGFFLSAPEAE